MNTFMVLWCAVVLFPSIVGGGALYLVVRPGGLGAVRSSQYTFCFLCPYISLMLPLFGPFLPLFTPNLTYFLASFFPSPPFSSIIQLPGTVSPYQDGSGWIGRLTTFLLPLEKGRFLTPEAALDAFYWNSGRSSFCEHILRPLHHYAIIFLPCQPLFLPLNDFAPIISACRYFTNFIYASHPKHLPIL